MLSVLDDYFLQYQKDWINDHSRIKVLEKSRRIGGTYMESFEDVEDIVLKREYVKGRPVTNVYFSSKDELAGKEYIQYCVKWAKVFNVAAHDLGEQIIDEEKGVKALVLQFDNGGVIHALSSNPYAFNSKGGKIVWDETALHKDQKSMWSGAKPAAMWGYPIRILSTHKGLKTLFYQFVQDIKDGKSDWSLHTVDIFRAVEDGLVDKILNKKTTKEEREAWLEQERKDCRDEDIWQEDYCCNPRDSTTAYFTYELIRQCEREGHLLTFEELINYKGELFAGWDVAAIRDLSVLFILEKIGLQYIVKHIRAMEKIRTSTQKKIIESYLWMPNLRRICIDQTGMGIPITTDLEDLFGTTKVEGVTFTNASKEVMATTLKGAFEDVSVIIPPETILRDSIHSICKTVTVSGKNRYDADRTDKTGHADHFWALALGYHAANSKAAGKQWANSTTPWGDQNQIQIQQSIMNSYKGA